MADRDVEGYIDISSILTSGDDLFGLRVKGDSMLGAGIHQGDIVVVHRQPLAESGDLVVVVKDGEASVRWLVRNGKIAFLKADALDGEYPDESLTEGSTIIGKVVFLLRNYSFQLINPYTS